jgi:predicted nucleotidyltransferase
MNYYPTIQHENAAKKIVDIYSKDKRVMSILLVCSCARGKATRDSCLDICVIVKNNSVIKSVENGFKRNYKKIREFKELRKVGKYSHVDFFASDGKIEIQKRDWTSGPDDYEIEIGNIFVYSVVLFDRNKYFARLKKKFVPYYSERMRKKRLKEVKMYMNNNLDHIPLYVKRKLYFQAFNRLYNASQEFLQALFIKNRMYPISYTKWIKEQLVVILGKPEIYMQLVELLQIKNLESDEVAKKAQKLKSMSRKYL